jgi:hypothetical protein
MAKTWATKCCSGTYKNNYQLCCGIKVKQGFYGLFALYTLLSILLGIFAVWGGNILGKTF